MTVGNLVGGWAADRDLKRGMLFFFALLLVGLAALVLHRLQRRRAADLAVRDAAACSALSPAIQTRLMDVAHESQSIAAALNHSALNIANAAGAFLGGSHDRRRLRVPVADRGRRSARSAPAWCWPWSRSRSTARGSAAASTRASSTRSARSRSRSTEPSSPQLCALAPACRVHKRGLDGFGAGSVVLEEDAVLDGALSAPSGTACSCQND